MNIMHQKTAIFLTALLVVITAVSCEETEVLNRQGTSDRSLVVESPSAASISNGFLKAKLDHYAYEAYAGFYGVEVSPENSQVIDKATLMAWVKANEKNKHVTINQKNRTALEAMEDVRALLIQAPAGATFQASVFVLGLGSLKSLVITDIRDITIGPRLKVANVRLGFLGSGYLDPQGSLSCVCHEEIKLVLAGTPPTKCGPCPDLGDDPTFPY